MSMVIALKTADGIVLGADSYSTINYKDGTHFDYHTGIKLYAFDNLAIGVTGVSGIYVYRAFLFKHEIVELPDFINSMLPHYEDSVSKFVFEFMEAWDTYDCYVTKKDISKIAKIQH